MKVLVVGGGGREHALCWAIAGSPLVTRLCCAPGNAGIAQDAECIDIAADNIDGIIRFVQDNGIEFVVIGPEAPLVAGLADKLLDIGIKSFGPSAAAAVMEGSKGFMKDFCARHDIPTAAYGRFSDIAAAKAFIAEQGAPIVVKADGLAAGKGVIIAETIEQANAAVNDMLEGGAFGDAGAEVVIEEFLGGEEASFFVLCDGETALPLASAQDHKRVGDGDTGPNTGGMGAYSPAPIVTEAMVETIMETIIEPTMAGMKAEGKPYKGVLYAGLMIEDRQPKLLEYNVRFGDPECQVLMMRLMSDLLPALIASADGVLKDFDLRWYDETALTVVMAANGYPGAYDKGSVIKGLDKASEDRDITIFHAGTAFNENNEVCATGGRVIAVTALGDTVAEAQASAYKAVDTIDWPGGFCRRDIGWRAVEREAKSFREEN
ncbi:MAG: phosphoribosylamine--glycine ligase [Alphaproteobacteria bacterium]|nr:phosphoribosylamine--glycine ligase [Alphaproteobacteria bacterium]